MLSRGELSVRYKIMISKTEAKMNISFEEDIKLAHEQTRFGKRAQGCKVQVTRSRILSKVLSKQYGHGPH